MSCCCLCCFLFEQVLRGACIESGGQTERWFQGRGNQQSELELAHLLLAALRDSGVVEPEPEP
jgi:hypothetical protein